MLARLMRLGLMGLAVAGGLLFVALGLIHMRYPVEMDFIEGAMMDQIARLARGEAMYVAPTAQYVPLAYMPLYSAVVALIGRCFGVDFWTGRLVSYLSTLGVASMIGYNVGREARDRGWGVIAGGIYLMGYGVAAGGHFDAIRPDSLMLFLALAGLTILRWRDGVGSAMFAAAIMVLSFFTKQHGMWFLFVAMTHLVINDRRRLLPFAAVAIVGCAGGYGLLSLWLGPWFNFYTWNIPSHWSQLSSLRIKAYIGDGLLGHLGPLMVPTLLALGVGEPPWKGRAGVWTWVLVGGLGTGLLATLDPHAWRHVFMPTFMTLCIAGPIALSRMESEFIRLSPSAGARASVAISLLLAGQFIPLIYSIGLERGHRNAAEARAQFVQLLRELPGPVWVPTHGFYASLAGKAPGMQFIAIDDIERAPGNSLLLRDPKFLDRMVEELRSGPDRPFIVADGPLEKVGPIWGRIAEGYRVIREIPEWSEGLAGITGHRTRPDRIYAPIPADSIADTGPFTVPIRRE
ncbi:MAG: hypothetical protein ABIU54_08225 [Candidatus Eisenbacteria bacterium]